MSTPREELNALIASLSAGAAAQLLPELRLLKLQAEAGTERRHFKVVRPDHVAAFTVLR
jgi:hypothetical protein